MIRFEETKERVVKDTIVRFRAEDGTVFEDENDCLKWEKSCYGMLFHKLSEFKIKDEYEWTLDDGGENYYITVIPTQESHIDTLNQLHRMFGGSNLKEEEAKFNSIDIGLPIIVGYRFDGAYALDWVWFHKVADMLKEVTDGKFVLLPIAKK